MKIGQIFNPYKMFVGAFIPTWLLERPVEELSLGAKVVYARLALFAGERGVAFPFVETIADGIGLSERQVSRYLSELDEKKLIRITWRTSQCKSSIYEFLVHEWFLESLAVKEGATDDTLVTDMSPPPRHIRRDPPDGYGGSINRISEETQEIDSVSANEETSSPTSFPEKEIPENNQGLRGSRVGSNGKSPVGTEFSGKYAKSKGHWSTRDGTEVPKTGRSPAGRHMRTGTTPTSAQPRTTPPKSNGTVLERTPEDLTETDRLASLREVEAKAQARSSQQKLEQAQKNEQRLKNFEGKPVSESVNKTLKHLESYWTNEISKTRQDVTIAKWDVKVRGQARMLIEKYNGDLVAIGLRYLIAKWSLVNERFFRGRATLPTMGILLKFHETLMVEAQQWVKFEKVEKEYKAWLDANPNSMYPPSELQERYKQAQREMGSLGGKTP